MRHITYWMSAQADSIVGCKIMKRLRGHPDLNQGPLDLQSNALPLSYIPMSTSAPNKGVQMILSGIVSCARALYGVSGAVKIEKMEC